jgi:hypothetical protein
MGRNSWSSLLDFGKPFQFKDKSPTAAWPLIGIRRAAARMKKSFAQQINENRTMEANDEYHR